MLKPTYIYYQEKNSLLAFKLCKNLHFSNFLHSLRFKCQESFSTFFFWSQLNFQYIQLTFLCQTNFVNKIYPYRLIFFIKKKYNNNNLSDKLIPDKTQYAHEDVHLTFTKENFVESTNKQRPVLAWFFVSTQRFFSVQLTFVIFKKRNVQIMSFVSRESNESLIILNAVK